MIVFNEKFQAIVSAMPKLKPPIAMKRIENAGKIDYVLNVTDKFEDECQFDQVTIFET